MASQIDPEDYYTVDLIREMRHELLAIIVTRPIEGLSKCRDLLNSRASYPDARYMIYEAASNVAVHAGRLGLDLLADIATSASRPTQRRMALQALWSVTQGSLPRVSHMPDVDLEAKPEDSSYARSKLSDLIVDALNNRNIMDTVLFAATHEEIWAPSGAESFTDFFLKTAADSTISLTSRAIDKFAALIAEEADESEYQKFLTANPVFLDPLAAEIIPLAPLGLEYKTDFVIRRHDGSYLVVEIEKPHDRIFTKAHNFTAEFTHASGQILDFQHWVSANIAYAQKRFPRIQQPQGLLVMGTRSRLPDRCISKLNQWQTNSRFQDFMTYDDLLKRARLLLRSLRPGQDDC